MTSDLENQVSAYQQWRDELRNCIQDYQNWLETNGHADIQRSLRIYDLIESLRNDRMILAFLALTCGLILETVTRGRRELKRLAYLVHAAPTADTGSSSLKGS